MTNDWGDLVARAKGLGTHLLHRGDLITLAHLPDLPALATELAHRGFPIEEQGGISATTLDLAVRRDAAVHLRTLARWAGARSPILAVVLEDEDRRAIRALLRGAIQQAPPVSRLAGLVATPSLPERVLEDLARQPSVVKVWVLLRVWNHPYASALAKEAAKAEPDLLALEVAINRVFASRALRGARRAGNRGLLARYVRRTIDIENAYSALVLAGSNGSRIPDVFLSGGELVSRAIFERAAGSKEHKDAVRVIAAAFAGTPLATVFSTAADSRPGDLERLVLGARIAELRRNAFQDPLGPAPVLLDALRVRAEVLDLRHVIWSLSVHAPAVAEALVSS